MYKSHPVFSFLVISLMSISHSHQDGAQYAVRDSINHFAVDLLKTTSEEAGDSLNLALSPYTVWTLLTIISEGARGNTLKQLEDTLLLPTDKNLLQNSHKEMAVNLLKASDGVTLEVANGIFTTSVHKLNPIFQLTAKKFYNVEVQPTDFNNLTEAKRLINTYISNATKNRIQNLVHTGDLSGAQIFLTSAMHFKGQWYIPFNKSATAPQSFYDEQGNRTGDVQMMYQSGSFPYKRIDAIKSHVVELPYGNNDKASMIIVLPYRGETLINALKLLTKVSIAEVMLQLQQAAQKYEEEETIVYLPRFSSSSDLTLNVVLDKMGIKDVFSENNADLLGIFPHYLYLSRVIHKAIIDVNEEGTEASAAAGGSLSYKSPPPKLICNKPFAYFIVDKPTGCVIFSGKITNPNFL